MRKSRMIFGVFALSLASTSCLRQQRTQARAFTPPPTRTWPTVDETAPSLPDAPQIAPDEASMVPPQLPQMTPDTLPEVPEAPKRVARRPTPPVTAPKPVGTTPAETPPAPPRLAQMFTPEQFRDYSRALDESLERVNQGAGDRRGEKSIGGSEGNGTEDSNSPKTSRAGAGIRSSDRSQFSEACRSLR